MIGGALITAGGLMLAGVTITAAGPVFCGLAPFIAVALIGYGVHVFTLNRRRRNRRGGFIL